MQSLFLFFHSIPYIDLAGHSGGDEGGAVSSLLKQPLNFKHGSSFGAFCR
jgi:hypothetical protein